MNRQLVGTCLCGVVRYRVADEYSYSLICHCSQCRRATGAGAKPFAGIEREKLQVIQGADSTLKFGGDLAHDVRCSVCGSLLFSVVRKGRFVHVTLGSLVDEPSIRPSAHIHVGSKAAWEPILDDLPQHRELP
jgi:hypothetical protein